MNKFMIFKFFIYKNIMKNVIHDICIYDENVTLENIYEYKNHDIVIERLEYHTQKEINDRKLKNIYKFTNDNEKDHYFIEQNTVFIRKHTEINIDDLLNPEIFSNMLLKSYIVIALIKKYFYTNYSDYIK